MITWTSASSGCAFLVPCIGTLTRPMMAACMNRALIMGVDAEHALEHPLPGPKGVTDDAETERIKADKMKIRVLIV